MQGSATPSTSPLSTPRRLLIAFVLGVLAGLVFLFDAQATAFLWWMLVIPAAVLLIAMLLGILLDPAVRQGTIAPLRPIISLLLFVLIASAIVVALALLPATQPAFLSIAFGVQPFATGLAAAFTIGSSGRLGLAVVGALVAWLGSAISIVINVALSYSASEKMMPGVILPIAITIITIACVIAVLGGLVGRLLRTRFLGTPSTSPTQTRVE